MKIRRVDFSADEWLVGTNPLTNAERGLYITACAMIYSHAGPVLRVDLKAQCRDHGKSFNCQLDRLVALGKLTIEITLNGAEISSKRCLNELEMASKRIQKASENGTKGNEIKKMRNTTRSLDRDANYQLPTTNYQKKEKREAKASPKKATRWVGVVCAEWVAEAEGIRLNAHLSPIDASLEADKFADYWPAIDGAKGCKRDWHATWRNWVRNAGGGPRGDVKRSAVEKLYAGAYEAGLEWDRRQGDRGADIPPIVPLLDRRRS